MINAIQIGVKRALTQWQISVLVYAVNLVFALGLAIAFKGVLADEFALRDVSSRLVEGFDFTFLSDLNYASASISSLFKMFNWLLVGYGVMSIFLSGGMIAALKRQAFSLPDFFADSVRYFGRFITLAVFFALTMFVPLIAFAIFSAIGNAQSESAHSEVPAVLWALAGIEIAAIKLAFFYLIFDVAKFEVVSEAMKPFQAFVSAFKIVLKNFIALFGIVLFFLLCVGVIGFVLHVLAPKGETGAGVFALVLMQQVLVASRVFFRVATVGGLLEKYQEYRAILNEKKLAEAHRHEAQSAAVMSNDSEIKPLESASAQTEPMQPDAETPAAHQDTETAQKPEEQQP